MSGYVVITSAPISTSSSGPVSQKAVCPAGKKAIGGGYSETTGNSILVRYTGPTTTTAAFDSWTITAEQILSFTGTYTVMAICVTAL